MNPIRTATANDTSAVAVIYNEYVGKNTLDLEQRDANFFQKMMEAFDDRETMLVIEYEGSIAGYGLLKKYSWKEGYRFTGETSVFISSSYRQKGLGGQLKKALIEKAKTLHYKHLVAHIMARNTVSIHYNLQLGYEMVGIQKKAGCVNGEWLDVAILQLVFE